MDQWENMWLEGLKFTVCSRLKVNVYKKTYIGICHWRNCGQL